MADTLREMIIAGIYSTLSSYESFTTLVDATVDRGRIIYDPDIDPLPIISIIPRPEESERTRYGTMRHTMPVEITCLAAIGDDNPSELGERILGEIVKAVFSRMPTEAEDMVYTGGGVDQYPDQLGQAVLAVGITINIIYQTDIGDPYSYAYGGVSRGFVDGIGLTETIGEE